MSMLIKHALREIQILRESTEKIPLETEADKLFAEAYRRMEDNVLAMVAVFSTAGYSGSIAPTAISMFNQLANFRPLTLLTGNDGEWTDNSQLDKDLLQNTRCNSVFKNTKTGQCFQVDAVVWFRKSEPNEYFTNGESRVYIKQFPYAPIEKTFMELTPELEEMFAKAKTGFVVADGALVAVPITEE